ncbi:NitT/TauT family transport system ATP-binding protein [Pseudonocardia thermophila]|uniref:NitT/TauT family transport system ATP-binding protein n=1 Tax=Pseudonocardia thermophila TaxID=1848 RepID=A0A1M6TRU5_PSETH|nr:ABC transporter ATP-binding protein [Pseudonocardia thermophila]SHK59619.1 NitT/TauT family transport system ATP-binding protein [Pseudonocardia thermophila]
MSIPREPLIELVGVSRSFGRGAGRVVAVRDLDLTVGEGEIITVVGPSGCGKSTLLNMLARLDEPDAGELRFRGRPAAEADVEIGYVTQSDSLFPWRTLLANVEYPLEIRGVPKAERRERAMALLARVGLAGFENHLPRQLSGGMRQRGNIVRALVYEPDIVLMDEPFGALDAQTRLLQQRQLQDICAEERTTVVFITHDLQEAILLGDRVVVMTARPGSIKLVREVGIDRPRDLDHIHEQPRFQHLVTELWDALRDEVLRAAPAVAS